jgi:hypothetical protein
MRSRCAGSRATSVDPVVIGTGSEEGKVGGPLAQAGAMGLTTKASTGNIANRAASPGLAGNFVHPVRGACMNCTRARGSPAPGSDSTSMAARQLARLQVELGGVTEISTEV